MVGCVLSQLKPLELYILSFDQVQTNYHGRPMVL